MEEWWPFKPSDEGSSPSAVTMPDSFKGRTAGLHPVDCGSIPQLGTIGLVAQTVERQFEALRVVGAIPTRTTMRERLSRRVAVGCNPMP